MTTPRQFLVIFRLTKGNSPQQQTIINASDVGTARRIFAQQNPACALVTIREIPSRG